MQQPAEQPASAEPRSGDAAVIDLLRLRDALGIGELAESLGLGEHDNSAVFEAIRLRRP
jgi:hypothetical protein